MNHAPRLVQGDHHQANAAAGHSEAAAHTRLTMLLQAGYELTYESTQPTPMLLALSIHSSRAADLVVPDQVTVDPATPICSYYDSFGNLCSRIVVPPGVTRVASNAVVRDHGTRDEVVPAARQTDVQDLPGDTLQFLLPSRYCETDLLGTVAWQKFGGTPPGWTRVQAICDFVHDRIAFDYQQATSTRTAAQAYDERVGVCRDYTHLGIALCRAMNIPARYCTGYLSDIGTPPPWGVPDFAAWFEAYLDGRWYTFDPRNNEPRIGRVLIARGRDAADVPLSHTFGPASMIGFTVWTHEIAGALEATPDDLAGGATDA